MDKKTMAAELKMFDKLENDICFENEPSVQYLKSKIDECYKAANKFDWYVTGFAEYDPSSFKISNVCYDETSGYVTIWFVSIYDETSSDYFEDKLDDMLSDNYVDKKTETLWNEAMTHYKESIKKLEANKPKGL